MRNRGSTLEVQRFQQQIKSTYFPFLTLTADKNTKQTNLQIEVFGQCILKILFCLQNIFLKWHLEFKLLLIDANVWIFFF
jgi:hypothetical protein